MSSVQPVVGETLGEMIERIINANPDADGATLCQLVLKELAGYIVSEDIILDMVADHLLRRQQCV